MYFGTAASDCVEVVDPHLGQIGKSYKMEIINHYIVVKEVQENYGNQKRAGKQTAHNTIKGIQSATSSPKN